MGTYKMITLSMLDAKYTSEEFNDRKLYKEKVKLWKAWASDYQFIQEYAQIVGMLKWILRNNLDTDKEYSDYYFVLCDLYNYHFNGVPLATID